MDKFLEMKTFAAVVDSGSFVQAADALNISKPAVSRHVSELEQRLGVFGVLVRNKVAVP